MNKETSNIFRIVVAVIFLILGAVGCYNGIVGLVRTIGAGNAITFTRIWSLGFNVAMLLAGLLALLKVRKTVCIVLAIVLFIGFAVSTVTGIVTNQGFLDVLLNAAQAICSFFFIGCVDRTSTDRPIRRKKKK